MLIKFAPGIVPGGYGGPNYAGTNHVGIQRSIDACLGCTSSNMLGAWYGTTYNSNMINPADAGIPPSNNIGNGTYWFRIIRDGGTLTVQYSYDGVTFSTAFTAALADPTNPYNELLLGGITWQNVGSYTDYEYVKITDLSAVQSVADGPFQVRYVANLNVADSLINLTNTGANGAMPFGPGIGPQAGNLCVNVYAFAPDEQMVGCCSCHITPNGLASLSVYNDIRAVTLTGLTPNSMVVKLVATGTGGTVNEPTYTGGASACNQSAAGLNVTHPIARAGLAAWASTGHVPGLFVVPGAPAPFAITETRFTPATLSDPEILSLNNRCTAIIGNGSTFGTCRSCTPGGRGGSKL